VRGKIAGSEEQGVGKTGSPSLRERQSPACPADAGANAGFGVREQENNPPPLFPKGRIEEGLGTRFPGNEKRRGLCLVFCMVIPAKPVPDLIGEWESSISIPRSADKQGGLTLLKEREYFRRVEGSQRLPAAEVVVSTREDLYGVVVSRIGSSAGRETEYVGW
jgi:hypothetical protein